MRGGARPGAGRKPAPHKSIGIRLPQSMAEAVEKAAVDTGVTVSEWIRSAIIKKLEKSHERIR